MQDDDIQPGIFGGILERYADEFWLLFRVIFALIAFLHGIQKAFGMWGFPSGMHPLSPMVDIAGWVELISSLLIGFGLLTRLGAGALCVTMLVAYFMVHANSPVWPWPHLFPPEGGFGAHGGEVPILWFIVAGIIGVIGGGKYALDRVIFKREPL